MACVATERLDDADVDELRRCFAARCSRRRRADDRSRLHRRPTGPSNQRLYEAGQRPRLLARILDLWAPPSTRARPILSTKRLTLEDAVRDHEPLFRAITLRDPQAAEAATRAHLEGAASRVLAALRAR